MSYSLAQKISAEAFGSFWMVFAGTAAICVNDATHALGHLGVASVFGLVVFAMIAAVGEVSGAHFNPAVSLGFYLAGRFPLRHVAPYVAAQCAGAILASLVVRLCFSAHLTLGATLPSVPTPTAWLLEVLLTLGLMFVILSVSTGAREKGITAGLSIGGTVAVMALFAGPLTGASMNPARSLGPALISGQWQSGWIYLTAPWLGAALAVFACRIIQNPDCCPQGCKA